MNGIGPDAGGGRLDVAVIGSGISGLSAAWLLSHAHDVTLFEAEGRIGGHSDTAIVDGPAGPVPVDTGFIVYNEATYPNLTALFAAIGAPTVASDMSFAASLDQGAFEYSGGSAAGLFARPANLVSPRFWSMMRDLLRFYREAPRDLDAMGDITLDGYLSRNRYGRAFRDDHLYPMAAAIWSTSAAGVGRQSAASFTRFCRNHGLLALTDRPVWRTVAGGSREYVRRLAARLEGRIHAGRAVVAVERRPDHVEVVDAAGERRRYAHAVVAVHADQALRLLPDASPQEREVLGAFRYQPNAAVLHRDPALMPRRRAAWSSWNYVGDAGTAGGRPSVTYWMNRLQPLQTTENLFVTLNPATAPREDLVIRRADYEHPVFDVETMRAQRRLWSLQGVRRTWFCGAYFGDGFHEDGLQAGLAVAEDLGGLRRPWRVAQDSGRIVRGPVPASA